LTNKTRCPPSEKNTWAKATARLTVERQAAVLDLIAATTTTTLVGVRPLAGGSSHFQEATHNSPINRILQKTCARESMKDAMHDP
jgi:PIN domain nuclease of toxin-antitoxin system